MDSPEKVINNPAVFKSDKLKDKDEKEYVDTYAYREAGSPPDTLKIAEDAEPPTIVLIVYRYRAH